MSKIMRYNRGLNLISAAALAMTRGSVVAHDLPLVDWRDTERNSQISKLTEQRSESITCPFECSAIS